MTKLAFVLVASLAAVGCKKKDGGGGGGTDCATVIPAGVDRVAPELKKDLNASDDKMTSIVATMKATLLKRCTEDKWPEEHLKCLSEGKTSKEMEACDSKLPKDQKEKLDKDLQAAMTPYMKMDGSPDSAAKPAEGTPPAAGSDTGSAAPAPAAAPDNGSAAGSAAPAAGSGSAQ